jgi:hypothetical protein
MEPLSEMEGGFRLLQWRVDTTVRHGGNLLSQVDVDAISEKYGDLSIFILNVAAGLDGVPEEPQAEQVFRDAFAQQMAATLPSLDPSDQQALAQPPQLRSAVQSASNCLPETQRAQIAEQWRQSVQSELPGGNYGLCRVDEHAEYHER